MVPISALDMVCLYHFWTMLILVVGASFLGSKNYPLDLSVMGGLGSESEERTEPEPAEADFELEPSELQPSHAGTRSTRTEPWAFISFGRFSFGVAGAVCCRFWYPTNAALDLSVLGELGRNLQNGLVRLG